MIVKTKTIEKTYYIGNCPLCGIEQKSEWDFLVDQVCDGCHAQKVKADNLYLIGAKIVDFKCDYDGAFCLSIVGTNGKKYNVSASCEYEGYSELEIVEYSKNEEVDIR